MNEQFCNYEISKKLKDLGFNEECLAVFYQEKFMNGHVEPYVWNLINSIKTNSDCNSVDIVTAPLWQQVIDWLREKHNISVEPNFSFNTRSEGFKFNGIDGCIRYLDSGESNTTYLCEINNYYEARRLAILNALDKIKKV